MGVGAVGGGEPAHRHGDASSGQVRLGFGQLAVEFAALALTHEGDHALARHLYPAIPRGALLIINLGKINDTHNASAKEHYLHRLRNVYTLVYYLTCHI